MAYARMSHQRVYPSEIIFMRALLFIFLLLLTVMGCTSTPNVNEVAARSAKQYYKYLLTGQYESFVDGKYHTDRIPGSYRNQLVDNAKMYMAQQEQDHRGIKDVRIVNAKVDTSRHVANVFLVFAYGDSTSEEIVVPMVEKDNVWYMK